VSKPCEHTEILTLNNDDLCDDDDEKYCYICYQLIIVFWTDVAVGSARPDRHEIDPHLMLSATVYCDSKEACLKEAGDIILADCDVYAELGEVIAGMKGAERQQTTVFKSVGMAIEDVVTAKLVYDKYIQEKSSK